MPIPRLVPSNVKFELLANPEPSKYSTPPATPPVVVPVPPFAIGSAEPLYETANVPADVIGDPEIERKAGTDSPTELTPELPPLIITAPPPVAEIIGCCGVPVIEMFEPAVIEFRMFDANTRPDPTLISVLLVSIPPSVCRRPLSTEDPRTRDAPLTVTDPALISVLLVSMPPNVCKRPPSIEDPETRNAPLTVAEVLILRRAVLNAFCVLLILFTKGKPAFVVLVARTNFEPVLKGEEVAVELTNKPVRTKSDVNAVFTPSITDVEAFIKTFDASERILAALCVDALAKT